MSALLAILAIFLAFPSSILAISLSFSGQPSSVNQEEEFEIDVFLECSSCKDSYLRAVFSSSGTKYFGYTKNNTNDWVNTTEDKTLYFHVLPEDMIESSWSGKLKVKADLNSSYYDGPGEYNFKIGRYTSAISSASWSNDVTTISIIAPTPTSTPTPTPTNTPTNAPTSTSTPTSTPTSLAEASSEGGPPSPDQVLPEQKLGAAEILSAATDSSPYSIFFQESTVSADSTTPFASSSAETKANLTLVGFGLLVLSGSVLFFRNNPY